MFVCHGNICRSPMAEFLLCDMAEKNGLSDKFLIKSAATSREEIGNGVHMGTARILDKFGIDYSKKKAVQLTASDKDKYDYFIGMDNYNVKNMRRILGDGNIMRLLDFSLNPRDIADPWYTGNFNETYNDIIEGCDAFLKHLRNEGKI